MKILTVIDWFSKSNGVARVNERLAREWIRKGHEVAILTYSNPDEFKDLRIIEVNERIEKSLIPRKKQLENIIPIIEGESPDIIFSNAGKLGYLVSQKYHVISRFDACLPEDILYSYKHRGLKSFIGSCINFLIWFFNIRRSIIAISPSKYTAKVNTKFFLKKFQYIYNGVDRKTFNPSGGKMNLGEKSLLFVGEIRASKGIDFLVKSFKNIKKNIPGTKLYIIGKNSYPRFYELIEGDDDIIYLGVKDNIEQYMRGCDVFVFPSYSESFGLTIVEAQACGKPVVAFNIIGIPEVVEDGFSGFLVKKNDIYSFVDRICLLLKDKDLRQKMGENGIKSVEKFDWGKSADEHLEMFNG